MSLTFRRKCRGCGRWGPNQGPLFTHGYCRSCWPGEREKRVRSGKIKCGPLGPDRELSPELAAYFALHQEREAEV